MASLFTVLLGYRILLLGFLCHLATHSHGQRAIQCARNTYPPDIWNAQKVHWFDVDLDEKPEYRWVPIIEVFEPQLVEIRDTAMKLFDDMISPHLWSKGLSSTITNNPDCSPGPLACLLARSLAPLAGYFAHSLARGTVNDKMTTFSVFFPILDHRSLIHEGILRRRF